MILALGSSSSRYPTPLSNSDSDEEREDIVLERKQLSQTPKIDHGENSADVAQQIKREKKPSSSTARHPKLLQKVAGSSFLAVSISGFVLASIHVPAVALAVLVTTTAIIATINTVSHVQEHLVNKIFRHSPFHIG
jgi:hypothetical protein